MGICSTKSNHYETKLIQPRTAKLLEGKFTGLYSNFNAVTTMEIMYKVFYDYLNMKEYLSLQTWEQADTWIKNGYIIIENDDIYKWLCLIISFRFLDSKLLLDGTPESLERFSGPIRRLGDKIARELILPKDIIRDCAFTEKDITWAVTEISHLLMYGPQHFSTLKLQHNDITNGNRVIN
ncbi:MAG: hypothetical protein Hyperionvirus18_46 [Hyperionvirus sp.]|uniref:Uncharacterized protein n=1 Tax=Hyperionvirus sp. TaxID=2487770 RepID=A0A3G5AA88_9VIRU|nr:MAG: hypothetical protein Hyperionvirus18_46 [Hyperionvirus sp.]